MNNITALSTADSILPSEQKLVRNRYGVIVSEYGDIKDARQTVVLWVDARCAHESGSVEQEIVKLTVPLTGPVKSLIEGYLKAELPGFEIYDWATWADPEKPKPLSGLTALVNLIEMEAA